MEWCEGGGRDSPMGSLTWPHPSENWTQLAYMFSTEISKLARSGRGNLANYIIVCGRGCVYGRGCGIARPHIVNELAENIMPTLCVQTPLRGVATARLTNGVV